MKTSTKLGGTLLLLFCFLAGEVRGWCREYCAHPQVPTCKKLNKYAGFEKLINEDECEYSPGVQGKNKLLCCYNEEYYEQYRVLNLARALTGAEEHEYPHQVKLVSPAKGGGTESACGGTVYNHEWIITAAHCISVDGETNTHVGLAYVIAGKADVDSAKDADKFYIAEIIEHEKWNSTKIGLGHDIALLRLNRSLPLEVGKIQPLRIAKPDYEPNYGGKGIIVGFGNIHEKAGVGSRYLMEMEAPIQHMGKAGRLSFFDNTGGKFYLDQHLNVGGDDSGVTVGKGDSGGPFICADENNKPLLCGIASFKGCDAYKKCRQANSFLRVDKFHGWIMDNLKNARQEEDLIFDVPMFPTKLRNRDVPPYLYRLAGRHQSCSGVLVNAHLVLVPAECIRANGGDEGVGGNIALANYQSEMPVKVDSVLTPDFTPNISANISSIFKRPLGLHDISIIFLTERQPEKNVIKLPPVGYKITKPALEYTLNEKVHGVESRRFMPMDRSECVGKINIFDHDLKLDQENLCMTQVYSAESECDRDTGGPLVCDGMLCGTKVFHACKASAFPEIFNDFTTQSTVRQYLEHYLKKYP